MNDDGTRIEPQVSVPQPIAANDAATAAAVPPLEPPGHRRGSYGLSVCPPSPLGGDAPESESALTRMGARRVRLRQDDDGLTPERDRSGEQPNRHPALAERLTFVRPQQPATGSA